MINSTVVKDDSAAPTHRVVFLHGLFGRGRNFASVAAALKPEAESLLVDLPNHGKSSWTEGFDYTEMADAVAEHLRENFAAGGPVDVVGHSMGGKVAMALALRHPDLVRRLAVLDISPTSAASGRGEFEHLLSSLKAVDLAEIHQRSDADEVLREPIPEFGVRSFLLQNLTRASGDTGGAQFAWEPNLNMLHAELPAITGFPDMGERQFTGPVLWVRGENSGYVTDDDGPAMRALFPKTVRITVRGAGHWVHSEKPEVVIAALRGFLLAE